MKKSPVEQKKLAAIIFVSVIGIMVMSIMAIAVLGGVIFAASESTCTRRSAGFAASSLTLADFGATDERLELVLRNSGTDRVTITGIEVSGEGRKLSSIEVNETLQPGETAQFDMPDIQRSKDCNSYSVTVTFDRGQIVDQVIRGSITGKMSAQ